MRSIAFGGPVSTRMFLRILIACVLAVCLVGGAVARAANPSPAWRIDSVAAPSSFSTDHNAGCLEANRSSESQPCDGYRVTVTNVGGETTDGSPVTITDSLPTGLKTFSVSAEWVGTLGETFGNVVSFSCSQHGALA